MRAGETRPVAIVTRVLASAVFTLAITLSADFARAADAVLEALARQIVEATPTDNTTAFRNATFEPALLARLKQLDRKPNPNLLDFDIFTNSQDPDAAAIRKTISSSIKERSPEAADVTISFQQSDAKTTIVYDVRRIAGSWKIFDIGYPAQKISLRKQLRVK